MHTQTRSEGKCAKLSSCRKIVSLFVGVYSYRESDEVFSLFSWIRSLGSMQLAFVTQFDKCHQMTQQNNKWSQCNLLKGENRLSSDSMPRITLTSETRSMKAQFPNLCFIGRSHFLLPYNKVSCKYERWKSFKYLGTLFLSNCCYTHTHTHNNFFREVKRKCYFQICWT